jgi:two-component system OmpR family response regulator
MTEKSRVLVVEDEENIRFLVRSALELAGMSTEIVGTGRDALDRIAAWRPDAVVLDIMLPDLDGFAILKRLRDQGNKVPVVFLTARDTTEDRVRGLRDGGDDYVVKPFEVAELVARVQLRLRQSDSGAIGRRLSCADLEMDTERHQVVRGGRTIHLSPTEFKLLHFLLVNIGRVLTRPQILDRVWSYDFEGDPAVVDTYMSYLRRKVDDVHPKLIHTVRGIGFVLRADP